MDESLEDFAELFGMALELLGMTLGLLCFAAAVVPFLLVAKLLGRIFDGPAKAKDKHAADDPTNPN